MLERKKAVPLQQSLWSEFHHARRYYDQIHLYGDMIYSISEDIELSSRIEVVFLCISRGFTYHTYGQIEYTRYLWDTSI